MSDIVLNGVSALIAAGLCPASARLIAAQMTSTPRDNSMSEETLEADVNEAESLVVLQSSTLLTMRVPASSEDELLLCMLRANIPVTPYQARAIAHVVEESTKAMLDIQRCLAVAKQHEFWTTMRELQSQVDRLQRIIDIRVASIAPIRKMPYDILLHIFAYCVFDDDDTYDPTCTRWQMMRVCYTWRDAMLSFTGLWSSLSIRFPVSVPAELERFYMHLDCNAEQPLNVYVNYISGTYTYEYNSKGLLSLLRKQSSRIRGLHIRICGDPHYIFRMEHHLNFPSLPLLEDITILSPRQPWTMNSSFIDLDAPNLKRARLFPHAGRHWFLPIPFRQLTHLHVLINDVGAFRLLESSPTLQVLRLVATRSFKFAYHEADPIPMKTYTSVTDLHIDGVLLPFVHTPSVKRLHVNGLTHHRDTTGDSATFDTIREFLDRAGRHVVHFAAPGELFLCKLSSDFMRALPKGIETLDATVDLADMLHVVVAVGQMKRRSGFANQWKAFKRLILRTDMEADISWEKEEIAYLCATSGLRVDVRPVLPDDDWQELAEDKPDWKWGDFPVDQW
ncbi:hypothetical protein BDZ89DRAFT_448785 [Hymenopellis radicata]|nr:hypothetical protein BDZ89DRAFT_448785 [Hymenopellis radicata]